MKKSGNNLASHKDERALRSALGPIPHHPVFVFSVTSSGTRYRGEIQLAIVVIVYYEAPRTAWLV